ncbi:hypothetical protein [Alteraurantiacibacter palmitatis]|uniref:Uncharacterized protein n=1 Tax=Alteraurantiacibacter palmitatis TaxID=2054628 RepID=A0ABV7EAH4_9SPHN
MGSRGFRRSRTYYGLGDVRASRYFALYAAQIGWLALGWYLYHHALWPSACTPANLLAAYKCSLQLPESGNWPEAALFSWLWSTPMLLALEISRRMNKGVR